MVNLNLRLADARGVRWGTGRKADLDKVDGLIIGGGDDISPALYGGEIRLEARLDPERDALERDLAEAALSRNIPVLGICRGAQMLNVALGGTLHQDAWGKFPDAEYVKTILPRRTVDIVPDTRFAGLVGTAPMKVNALHTQAVDRLGSGLRVTARDRSGMIQGIERIRDPFALGVQWHPEHLFYASRQRCIFRALVAAARAYSESRNQTRAVEASA